MLKGTKFLPSLGGACWDNDSTFLPEQRVTFKREKLNFTIIKETDDSNYAKYEMFQRINTGGLSLSDQELRNCLLIMINRDLYESIDELHNYEAFKNCIPISEAQIAKQYDMELVIRFLVYCSFDEIYLSQIDKSRNMDSFLTEEIEKYSEQLKGGLESKTVSDFKGLFDLLNSTMGEDSFKKWIPEDEKYKGAFLLSSFEAIVPGLTQNYAFWEKRPEDLKRRIKDLYSNPDYIKANQKGTRSLDRMCQLISLSKAWFGDEN